MLIQITTESRVIRPTHNETVVIEAEVRRFYVESEDRRCVVDRESRVEYVIADPTAAVTEGPSVAADAGQVSVSAVSQDVVARVSPVVESSTATATANNCTIITGTVVNAQTASATASADDSSCSVMASAGEATSSGAAQDADISTGSGDPVLVKSATGNSGSSSTTLTCTLSSAPASGNLLVFAMAGDKNTGALTLSGFTQVYSLLSSSVSLYLWYKVSAGTETSVSPSWATSSPAGNTAWYAEYGSPATTNSWSVVGQASNITSESTVTSQTTGTTGATSSAGIAIAVAAVDSSQSVTSVNAWGNSYVDHYSATGLSGRGAIFVADKVEASGATASSTFSYSGTADQVSAAIAVFAEV